MSSYYEKILATGEVKCIDEEIPFEIPQGWEWCRVSSIFQINPKVVAEDNTSAAFIPMEAISAGYGSEFRYYEKKWGEVKSGYTAFADNDIAFAKITPCFQNRKSAIFDGLPNGIGAGTTELKILRTYGETINRWFVLYFLESPYFIDEATFKGTANQQRIIVGYLENKLFPLPPLAEQERIVGKIGLVMPIIDKYSKSQEILDKMNVELNECLKKSVLQEAIQGRLVPQIAEEGTAHELLEQIKAEKQKLVKEGKLKKSALATSVIFRGDDNKYWEKKENNVVCIDDEIPFVIPNSWNWCRLKDIGRTETGTTPSKSHPEYFGNYIPFLSPANILGSKIISETQGLSNIGIEFGRVVPKNSILQVCIGGSIGKCAIVNKPATFNQQINSITPYLCNVEFVHIVLQSEYFRLAIMDKATGTATPIINRGNWETLLFPLPPLKEQLRIIEKYKGVTSIMSR